MQAVTGCAVPQSLVPASTRPAGGRLAGYESVGGYAKAAAKTGGKHLLGLGEAGIKYMSAQVGQWRSGSWEAASARWAGFISLQRGFCHIKWRRDFGAGIILAHASAPQ